MKVQHYQQIGLKPKSITSVSS